MLHNLHRYAGSGVFEPEQLERLTAAFDAAWKTIEASGVTFGSNGQAEALKELIALRVIAKARQGEDDPGRLRDDALLYLAETNRMSTGL